jgi:hypothetical protein
MENGQESQTDHLFFSLTSGNTRNMGRNEHWISADHLTSVLPEEEEEEEEEALTLQLEIPYQLEPLLSRFRPSKVQTVINNTKPKSSPG